MDGKIFGGNSLYVQIWTTDTTGNSYSIGMDLLMLEKAKVPIGSTDSKL